MISMMNRNSASLMAMAMLAPSAAPAREEIAQNTPRCQSIYPEAAYLAVATVVPMDEESLFVAMQV